MTVDFFNWQPQGSKETYLIGYHHEAAAKESVILIHGLGGNIFTYRYLAKALVKAGFSVWIIDLLGFGCSDKAVEINYSIKMYARLIHDFMKEMKIRKAHFIGHSMGGGVCLKVGLLWPRKVLSTSLLATVGFPLDIPAFLFPTLGALGRLAAPLAHLLVQQVLRWLVYEGRKVTDDMVQAYWLPLSQPQGMAALFKALQIVRPKELEKLSRQLNKVISPTLLIWGEKDPLIPAVHLEWLQKVIEKSEAHLLPKCGHLPQEERPRITSQLILDFIKKHR